MPPDDPESVRAWGRPCSAHLFKNMLYSAAAIASSRLDVPENVPILISCWAEDIETFRAALFELTRTAVGSESELFEFGRATVKINVD